VTQIAGQSRYYNAEALGEFFQIALFNRGISNMQSGQCIHRRAAAI
jgi:hypothetical protein